MRRQRNIPSEKTKQNSKKKKKLNKMETNNLPDSEFKTVLIRKLSEVSENLNIKKDVEIVKKKQSEMKDALTEMNNL